MTKISNDDRYQYQKGECDSTPDVEEVDELNGTGRQMTETPRLSQ